MHLPDFLARSLTALRRAGTGQLSMARRRIATLLALLLPLALAVAVTAPAPVTARDANRISKHVTQRMALMTSQRAAMEVLTDMMAGRSRFDRNMARDARRQLIRSTGTIKRRFKKEVLDRRSNARPLIWYAWKDFTTRAANAEQAAKALSTRSLPALRRSLPGLMQSCLNCHDTYRIPPNTFTTH